MDAFYIIDKVRLQKSPSSEGENLIGIMADSHDNLLRIRQAIRLFAAHKCELVIHAGDIVAPFSARELEALGCPVKAVFGNCDGEKEGLEKALRPFGQIQNPPLIFKHHGFRIILSHSNTLIESLLKFNQYDIIIIGHTHTPEIRKEKKHLFVNPGEAGGWVTGKSTVAVFDPKTQEAEIIVL
ncbi:MAG: metallophosphoesterase [Candidatus Aminicenantales bacterium]